MASSAEVTHVHAAAEKSSVRTCMRASPKTPTPVSEAGMLN